MLTEFSRYQFFFKIIFKNIISFKYGLILLGYSSIDSVLFLSPLLSNYLSYWFVLIFFLDLKTVPNISYYSVFGCFIFFFKLKRFLISLIAVSSILFFSLKRFLHLLSYIFYFVIFFPPWTFHHYTFKKINYVFLKNKSLLYSLKKRLKILYLE